MAEEVDGARPAVPVASDEGDALVPGWPPADDHPDPGWVAVVHTADRSGVVTRLAGVFSTRGVNVDHIASGVLAGTDATVTLTFRVSQRRCRQLVRSVERLQEVRSVLVRRDDDPRVHAAAVVLMPPGRAYTPPAELKLRWSGATAHGEPLLAEGPYDDIRRLVAHAAQDALTSGIVISAT